MKGSERLSCYAEQFDTVEVNATFYRLPTQAMIAARNKRLGEKFHLIVKGSRVITHLKKLRDCEEFLRKFSNLVCQIARLRVILWQLPPSFHQEIQRLEDFLSTLPQGVRHAGEFRHESWWDDGAGWGIGATL